MIARLILLLLSLGAVAGEGHDFASNYSIFQEFERLFTKEDPNQAISYLESNIHSITGQKKRIEVICPGSEPPIVQILDYTSDLSEDQGPDEDDEEYFEEDEEGNLKPRSSSTKTKNNSDPDEKCLQLTIKGKNFNLNLELNC